MLQLAAKRVQVSRAGTFVYRAPPRCARVHIGYRFPIIRAELSANCKSCWVVLPTQKGTRLMHSHVRAGFIIAAAASLISSTVIARTVQPTADSTTPALTGTKWVTQEAAGQWRASKLIGLNVYNNDNEKIGGITELIVDKSGKLDAVVVGAGGFLGLGEHDVAIPYRAPRKIAATDRAPQDCRRMIPVCSRSDS
jgi:sporulation protein YlmC with PRC-barrel domain